MAAPPVAARAMVAWAARAARAGTEVAAALAALQVAVEFPGVLEDLPGVLEDFPVGPMAVRVASVRAVASVKWTATGAACYSDCSR